MWQAETEGEVKGCAARKGKCEVRALSRQEQYECIH